MSSNFDIAQLLPLIQMLGGQQAYGTQTQQKKGMSPSQFLSMWEGNDSYLNWEEGDDVYWSDSGNDDAFWSYIDQKAAVQQPAQDGMMTLLLQLFGGGGLSALSGGNGSNNTHLDLLV